jgi:uracil-DNA glycosylase
MSQAFDPGPVSEPFATLARNYPGPDSYDPDRFRVEWGPVFHRGRLDGSARILVLGQDPGQHESIAHRCLVGEAGQRVQGCLWKLGIERSYVIVNAFLYSVYGQPRREDVEQLLKQTARYRKRWLDALLDGTDVRAVVAFGAIAEQAFLAWQRTASGRRFQGHFEPLTHPTMPDATARPRSAGYQAAMRRLLEQ